MRALPLAAGINKGGHYFRYFGPSGVRALPLAAGINVGGHYFGPSVLRAPAEQTKVATVLVRAALCRRCLTAVGHYFR